jgi:hypothetical protein
MLSTSQGFDMNVSSDSPDLSNMDPVKPQELGSAEVASPIVTPLMAQLFALTTPEEKISMGLQFMRGSISQEGSPCFREFWDVRRQILPFFKENLNPAIRSRLWGEYVELTVEARRLKEILEEQSVFATEQIDLAIQSVESDWTNFAELLKQAPVLEFLEAQARNYELMQRELNVLNNLVSRLTSLRKEVMKTDMRIRFKTKFFKRLSDLGDHVFPKRKALIESVSNEFASEVDRFIERHFKDEQVVGAPYYALREEIKFLQGLAKILTLSSAVFNQTRLKLSECWDKIKVVEKEYRKEVDERKAASSEQRQAVQTSIDALKEKSSEIGLKELDREIDQILDQMKGVSLHRDDIRSLRDSLFQLRAPYIEEIERKSRELEEAEKEALRVKKAKVISIKDRIASLTKEGEALDVDTFVARFDEIAQDLNDLNISKPEKQQIERLMRPIKDLLSEKKESSLLNLSDSDRKTLENLKTILQQRKDRRQEIKQQLETYRKSLGGSNLDFEKAMQLRELIDQEKELLEKANLGIQEIEGKISELEG